jgi:formate hydrogenlyase subunit 3/multisubunit Na+/H+ antiporter MnhD subunit
MNFKTTLVLLLLVVAVIAGIFGLEGWMPTSRERLEADASVLAFDEA